MTDQTAAPAPPDDPLREQIAEALMRWAEGNNDPQYAPIRRPDTVMRNAYGRADAVLAAVQPELDELAALRAVSRGYCPACGRGDAAPTVDDWEQQRQRAEQAEAATRTAIDNHASAETERDRYARNAEDRARRIAILDTDRKRLIAELAAQEAETMRQHERAERAEAAVARVRALAADMRTWCSPHGIAVDYAQRIDDALQTPAHDGPSVAECAANDARWWNGEKAGE